jgi:hypothetical protein
MTAHFVDAELPVAELNVDMRNPRMPEQEFADEHEAIEYLVDHADVGELVESIGNSGWVDFEPLIVLDDGSNTVLEGNRRLVALRVIADPAVRDLTGLAIPDPLHEGAKPDSVGVRMVKSRADARDYIGFKHINGAFKWDALAKARYAWEWLKDEPDITVVTVSKRLGDKHRTVSRMVNGYIVLRQAENAGFDRDAIEKKAFYFSHLYTALSTTAVRAYLGLPEPSSELLTDNPVPAESIPRLLDVMRWLYGQGDQPALIRSQNPDLKTLVNVLSHESSTRILESTSSLTDAYAVIEDRAGRFTAAIYELSSSAKSLLGQTSDYDGNVEVFAIAESLEKTVRNIRLAMQAEMTETRAAQ